ncbi:MAG TPA: 23S rRNA (guanosine(2251)-2'-O)-methyltransferase RlmB [candidate division Zixibacteria bacterium]|nr:23S rRNA (guanosine(2251)-2'-O)-methyltransferase RlmB [candidate division Zixibacteria bacterium]
MTVGRETLISGVNPVMEKLRAAPGDIVEIIVGEGVRRPALRAIVAQARDSGVTVRTLPQGALDGLAGGRSHQGVLARVAAYVYAEFPELIRELAASTGRCWVLVLDGITDPRNFGALLRTAEAVGIRDVVIPRDRSVGVTPAVVKASAGAVSYLRICRVTNLRRALAELKEAGLWIVGLDPAAPDSAYGRSYPERLGIVLGSEGKGIRPLVSRECDFRVSLPMRGKLQSLNVSVAGGVFLYELLRQAEVDKAGGTG